MTDEWKDPCDGCEYYGDAYCHRERRFVRAIDRIAANQAQTEPPLWCPKRLPVLVDAVKARADEHGLPLTWSIEEHGGKETLYIGRDPHHGLNIVQFTETASQWPEVRALLIHLLTKSVDQVERARVHHVLTDWEIQRLREHGFGHGFDIDTCDPQYFHLTDIKAAKPVCGATTLWTSAEVHSQLAERWRVIDCPACIERLPKLMKAGT